MSYLNPLARNWFIIIYARPGNCKSLEQARITYYLFREYRRTEKRYPHLRRRYVLTNQVLNPVVVEPEQALGHYYQWDKPEDFRYCKRKESCWKVVEEGIPALHRLHDCDLMIDEGSTIFPADGWQDQPMWLRKLWSQHRHNGIRIVMLTQDFKGIDVNIRRMCGASYRMRKLIGSRDISPTLPALSRWTIWNLLHPFRSVIWGVYYRWRIDPSLMEADTKAQLILEVNQKEREKMQKIRLVGIPTFHFITWWKVNLFDTTQDVREFKYSLELEHIEAECKEPYCKKKHITHRLK